MKPSTQYDSHSITSQTYYLMLQYSHFKELMPHTNLLAEAQEAHRVQSLFTLTNDQALLFIISKTDLHCPLSLDNFINVV